MGEDPLREYPTSTPESTPEIETKEEIDPLDSFMLKVEEEVNLEEISKFINVPVEYLEKLPPTEIIQDFLWLGSQKDAANVKFLKKMNIKYILNAAAQIYDSDRENLTKHFPKCFDFLEGARSQNARVLVHCQSGISRSASIVIGYLIKFQKLDFHAALAQVKNKRTIVAPNTGFRSQLVEFQDSLKVSS